MRPHRFTKLIVICILSAWLATAVAAEDDLPAVERVDAASRAKWLLEGSVTDRQTGQPVGEFTLVPGSISTDETGRSVIRWRENLKREMANGVLQWPRTSGFSVMRFQVTADGYQPAVTHIIRRGGPHTRLRLQLIPLPGKDG